MTQVRDGDGWELAQRLLNFTTLALLIGAVVAVVILSLEPSGVDICQETNSSFNSYRCPTGGAAPEAAELVVTTDMTLQADHFGSIAIGADDVMLDCDGHRVYGSGGGTGITIADRRNVTVADCTVIGFRIGIGLLDTTDSTVIDNEAETNTVGYSLTGSDRNTLRGNHSQFNESGFALARSDMNILDANSTSRGVVSIRLVNSNANTVQDSEVTKPLTSGIDLKGGTKNTVTGNFLSLVGSWGTAVQLSGVDNEVTVNTIEGGNRGVAVNGESNSISQNTVDVSDEGITIGGSQHKVADNVIRSARSGVVVSGSDNDISRNVVSGGLGDSDRGETAFWLDSADDNTFENNRAADLRSGFGISNSHGNTFTGNDAAGAEIGLWGDAVTDDNRFSDNLGFGLSEPLIVTEHLTLGADHEGTIIIDADGITLDCDDHRIVAVDWSAGEQLKRTEVGVQVREHTGVTIENCDLIGYAVGVGLSAADGNIIRANTANVRLHRSHDNRIVGNTAREITLDRSRRNVVRANSVAGDLRLDKAHRTIVRGNTIGTVRLINAHRNVVKENTLNGARGGIYLPNSDENVVTDNTVVDGQIRVAGDSNTVTGNTVDTDRKYAFVIGQTAGNNFISENVATGSTIGFWIYNSTSNTLKGNRAIDNEIGFLIRDTRNNTFESNDATGAVIPFEDSDHSESRNTFVDNLGF